MRLILIAALCIARPSAASAMTMVVFGDQIQLSGRVVAGDAEQFATLLGANPTLKTVVLTNSPGGFAAANDAITAMIEDHHLDTVVSGYCVSACAMIFLAGANRYFGDRNPLEITSLGFHGSYRADESLAPEVRLQQLETRVLERTGGKVDPALVERWLHFKDHNDTVRFRYPGATPSTTPTAYLCSGGGGANRGDFSGCDPIAGVDAMSAGIVTSTQIFHVR